MMIKTPSFVSASETLPPIPSRESWETGYQHFVRYFNTVLEDSYSIKNTETNVNYLNSIVDKAIRTYAEEFNLKPKWWPITDINQKHLVAEWKKQLFKLRSERAESPIAEVPDGVNYLIDCEFVTREEWYLHDKVKTKLSEEKNNPSRSSLCFITAQYEEVNMSEWFRNAGGSD